jgi:hypothetical protein
MAAEDLARDAPALRKRVDRFVRTELLILPAFSELLSLSRSFGTAAIFGGLIRDLALGHARDFSSDIDVVLKDVPDDVLARNVSRYGAQRNSFGGFRMQLGRWMFDLWAYDSTWAFAKGFVQPRELADLLRTTFFNWDAALFDLQTRELIVAPSYFTDLESRRLAINLRQTPNELGAAVRTLRLMWQGEAVLAPDLAAFLLSQIQEHGIHQIVDVDSKRSGRRRLTEDFVGSVAIALQQHQTEQPADPFVLFDFQRPLPLEARTGAG